MSFAAYFMIGRAGVILSSLSLTMLTNLGYPANLFYIAISLISLNQLIFLRKKKVNK